MNEPFFACDGLPPALPVNPNGLDTEGLVRTKAGDFWVVEEYSPSLLKINRHGKVEKRFFPEGLLGVPPTGYVLPTGYDSAEGLPAIFGLKRKLNRGFEGLAMSPDGETLYIGLQSPLNNPDSGVGNNSRNTRILAFDIATETVVGEYVYRLQPAAEFDTNGVPVTRPRDLKISGLSMIDRNRIWFWSAPTLSRSSSSWTSAWRPTSWAPNGTT